MSGMDPTSTGVGIYNIIRPHGAELNTGKRDQIPTSSMFPTEMLTKFPSLTPKSPGVDDFCRFQSAYSRTNPMFGPSLGCGFVSNVECRRKNASRESTSTLKCWLEQHRKYPYPSKGEKIMLAIMTRMTMTQVSTWFANARRRIKKEGGKMGGNRVTIGNDECHDVTIDNDECHDVTVNRDITDDGVESPVPTFPADLKEPDVRRKIPQRTTKLSWSVEDMVTSSVSRVRTNPPYLNREPMYPDFNPIFRQFSNTKSRDSN